MGLTRESRALLAAQVLWGVGFGLFGTLVPLYLKELGAGATDIGLVLGLGNVVAALAFIPLGLAADRFGRKPLIVITWVCSTVGAAAFLPLVSWQGAFVGSILYWVGSAAFPLMSAHLAALVPRARLGGELGIVYGGFFLGTILASPFAGGIAAVLGLRATLALGVVAFLLSSACTFLLTPTPAVREPDPPRLPRSFWTLLAVTPLAALIANVVNPLFAVYAREVSGVPLERIGIYVGLIAFGSAMFSILNGRVGDRVGPAPAVVGAGVALTVGAGLVVLSGRNELALGLGAFLLGSQYAANPVLAAALERILPASRSALGYSGFQLVYAIGFGTGGVLSGILYDADAALPLLVQVALALPVTATVALIVSRIVRARERATA